jgi:molybdopterin-binding protein
MIRHALPSCTVTATSGSVRGEITLEAAAQIMDVSVMTALRMARLGIIKGRQVCRGIRWQSASVI